MGQAIGATLGYAVGIAISPVPVAAVIMMLFSERARTNGTVFLLAWIVGVAAVTTVVLLIPNLQAGSNQPSTLTGWLKLVLGLLLLLLGVRQWRSRPSSDAQVAPPGWMDRISDMRPTSASGIGFLLSALNPKNLLLAAAAGATLGSLDLTSGQTVAAVAVFTVLASLTVGLPVVAYLVAGDRLQPPLDAVKDALIRNNATVMAVLFAVLGASLLGDGIQILTA